MICLMLKDAKLSTAIQAELRKHGISCQILSRTATDLESLYQPDVIAVVVDREVGFVAETAWLDMLSSLGRRIPVVAIGSEARASGHPQGARYMDTITWLEQATAPDVVAILDSCGAIGVNHKKFDRESVPFYNPQIPLHMLQNNGALSIMVINAQSFRKIAIEYGSEVYHRVQDCFNQILYDLWGAPGSFRSADILCRRNMHSNTYFIFLEQSRSSSSIPAPGVLERLSDRIAVKLQNAFWHEIFQREGKMMPDCIRVVPELAVGFSTVVYNPCVDALEMVEQLLDTAQDESRVQISRIKNRQRELVQTLIQTPGLLLPNYQAVFQLGQLTKKKVEEAQANHTLQPLQNFIYGFESLIRVRPDAVDAAFDTNGPIYMESRFLRPDVLFSLAGSAKVGLELDQACLYQAVLHSSDLPGKLMVNILPRNLYHVDRLKHLIMDREHIIFEVSESEAINNFNLMMKVRKSLEKMDMGIAADDFGKGYAGLERVVKIRPDMIKLDRSLIQDIHLDKPKQSFVEGLVRATRSTSSLLLAEGVERWEEARVLQDMGIDLIQGFLLHRPQPAAQIIDQLKQPRKLKTVA